MSVVLRRALWAPRNTYSSNDYVPITYRVPASMLVAGLNSSDLVELAFECYLYQAQVNNQINEMISE